MTKASCGIAAVNCLNDYQHLRAWFQVQDLSWVILHFIIMQLKRLMMSNNQKKKWNGLSASFLSFGEAALSHLKAS